MSPGDLNLPIFVKEPCFGSVRLRLGYIAVQNVLQS